MYTNNFVCVKYVIYFSMLKPSMLSLYLLSMFPSVKVYILKYVNSKNIIVLLPSIVFNVTYILKQF